MHDKTPPLADRKGQEWGCVSHPFGKHETGEGQAVTGLAIRLALQVAKLPMPRFKFGVWFAVGQFGFAL